MSVFFRLFPLSVALVVLFQQCTPKVAENRLELIHTTDVHGNIFPYDFINDSNGDGSYARVATYLKRLRKETPNVLVLDAGDILQGQPTAYYYNFIDTANQHIVSEVLNHLEYDAVTIGNHDIEAGHPVYDRFVKELQIPALAANAIKVSTEQVDGELSPYFTPYTMVEKAGRKIAILGLITPSIPSFLPEVLWSGMRFDDIVSSAKRWMPEIEAQSPDLVIALVHSGIGDRDSTGAPQLLSENAGWDLAREVPGIDLILLGHDHQTYIDSLTREDGSRVYLLNPGANANKLTHTSIDFLEGGQLAITPRVVELSQEAPDKSFVEKFAPSRKAVEAFVARTVGSTTQDIDSRAAFFGPSAFVDLIHEVQLSVFDSAQISLSAPLLAESFIPAGEIAVRDLFKLYRFENMVYLMKLTGQEIRDFLEESYDRWICTMNSPEDPLLRFKEKGSGLQHPYYNFDSAYGIRYSVDVSKPCGQRVTISRLTNGESFHPDQTYRVVVNSYRGNGGGGLLTNGARIPHNLLRTRVLKAKDKDLRYYLMQYISSRSPITPRAKAEWSFIPEEWTRPATTRDSLRLFSKE